METPAPVDLNKLKAILGNAKKVMKAADEKFPEKKASNVVNESYNTSLPSVPNYDETDEREPVYNTPEYNSQDHQYRDYTEVDVINSKLPSVIKEAMLKNPIPKPTMSFSKFGLEGLEDLIEKPTVNKSNKQPIQESKNHNSDMITISKTELNEMIDRRIVQFLRDSYNKNLTEEVIKRTIGTLIKEGKLSVKKK